MDDKLGSQKLPRNYWQAVKQAERPILKRTLTDPAFAVIRKSLKFPSAHTLNNQAQDKGIFDFFNVALRKHG
jgi:hypothetical protein